MKRKLNRFWRQITADKKKFGVLVTTLAVGLLLWGRLILLERVPKIATADDPPQAQSQQASAAPSPSEAAQNPAPRMAALPEVRTDLSDRLSLDLFAFRHNHYRAIPPEETPRIDIQPTDLPDDERVRRQVLEARLVDLRLQSVIQGGPRPLVVINGRLFRVGDSIDGFEIVTFTDRSATLTRDGLTFTLEMSTRY